MSLAFIDVLESHKSRYTGKITSQGANIEARLALEYRNLGLLYAQQAMRKQSVKALFKSFVLAPNLKTLAAGIASLFHASNRA
jgi:hypothetical protein